MVHFAGLAATQNAYINYYIFRNIFFFFFFSIRAQTICPRMSVCVCRSRLFPLFFQIFNDFSLHQHHVIVIEFTIEVEIVNKEKKNYNKKSSMGTMARQMNEINYDANLFFLFFSHTKMSSTYSYTSVFSLLFLVIVFFKQSPFDYYYLRAIQIRCRSIRCCLRHTQNCYRSSQIFN